MERIIKIIGSLFILILVCFATNHIARSLQEKNKIHRLIDDVGKGEDPLHPENSVATYELIEIGYPSLKNGGLELLLSDNLILRRRAENLLSTVTSRDYGFVGGEKEWVSDRARLEWLALWRENGSYDAFATEGARKESYLKWKRWIEKNR